MSPSRSSSPPLLLRHVLRAWREKLLSGSASVCAFARQVQTKCLPRSNECEHGPLCGAASLPRFRFNAHPPLCMKHHSISPSKQKICIYHRTARCLSYDSDPLAIPSSRDSLRPARRIGRRRTQPVGRSAPRGNILVGLDAHAGAQLCGFAAARTDVEEGDDGADDNADADY
jgi:hypothetical protein